MVQATIIYIYDNAGFCAYVLTMCSSCLFVWPPLLEALLMLTPSLTASMESHVMNSVTGGSTTECSIEYLSREKSKHLLIWLGQDEQQLTALLMEALSHSMCSYLAVRGHIITAVYPELAMQVEMHFCGSDMIVEFAKVSGDEKILEDLYIDSYRHLRDNRREYVSV